MVQGQATTQTNLVREGWVCVDVYDIYEIWTKGNSRLLFDPVKKIVHLLYS